MEIFLFFTILYNSLIANLFHGPVSLDYVYLSSHCWNLIWNLNHDHGRVLYPRRIDRSTGHSLMFRSTELVILSDVLFLFSSRHDPVYVPHYLLCPVLIPLTKPSLCFSRLLHDLLLILFSILCQKYYWPNWFLLRTQKMLMLFYQLARNFFLNLHKKNVFNILTI